MDGTHATTGDPSKNLEWVEGDPGRAVRLTSGPIDPSQLEAAVAHDGAGAICTFHGVTRDHNLGRPVGHLEYEAYPALARKALADLVSEIARRWPEARAAIVHRTGRVDIGETSVVVAASAPHRAAAFEACRFGIDTLKQTVPIWKKEVWADGSEWIEGQAPRPLRGPTAD